MNERPGDELDDAVIDADDTGMLRTQHIIAQEEIVRAEEELTSGQEDDDARSEPG